MLAEEQLQGVQLLRYTFDVVKPINADYNFDIAKAVLELLNSLLDALLLEVLQDENRGVREEARSFNRRYLTSVKEDGSMPMGKVPT